MKYKHEVFINHLPKVVIGSVVVIIGLLILAAALIATFTATAATVSFFVFVAFIAAGICVVVGCGIVFGGFEYVKILNTDPPNTKKPCCSQAVINRVAEFQERWGMNDMDFINFTYNNTPGIEHRRKNIKEMKFVVDEINNDLDREVRNTLDSVEMEELGDRVREMNNLGPLTKTVL